MLTLFKEGTMRSVALLVLLLSLVAAAQQAPPRPISSAYPYAVQAPPPSDSLPPDILILTGKDRPEQRPYAVPAPYYDLSSYNPRLPFFSRFGSHNPFQVGPVSTPLGGVLFRPGRHFRGPTNFRWSKF
jgi:hypothetical protein